MAISKVSRGHQHTVGAQLERLDDERGIYSPPAHDADNSHIGRVLEPIRAGAISRRVAAPVAAESH